MNFFYYSIYDRFIQRQPYACVCKHFLKKKNFSETIDWFFTKFHRNVPWIEVKNVLGYTFTNHFYPSINTALVNGSYLHYKDVKKFFKSLLLLNHWSDF